MEQFSKAEVPVRKRLAPGCHPPLPPHRSLCSVGHTCGKGVELWLSRQPCLRHLEATRGSLLGGPVALRDVTNVAYSSSGLPLCYSLPLPWGLFHPPGHLLEKAPWKLMHTLLRGGYLVQPPTQHRSPLQGVSARHPHPNPMVSN